MLDKTPSKSSRLMKVIWYALIYLTRPLRSALAKTKKRMTSYYFTNKVLLQAAEVGEGLRVNGSSTVTTRTYLGTNVNFNGMTITGSGKVTIGDNFHSGIECMIITSIHNYDKGNAIPYDNTYFAKDVTIADNVWLGSRVMILGGVTIGEGAIIQAGSVVAKSVPDYAIAGGHPAIAFKYRDIPHYKKLKAEKKFH